MTYPHSREMVEEILRDMRYEREGREIPKSILRRRDNDNVSISIAGSSRRPRAPSPPPRHPRKQQQQVVIIQDPLFRRSSWRDHYLTPRVHFDDRHAENKAHRKLKEHQLGLFGGALIIERKPEGHTHKAHRKDSKYVVERTKERRYENGVLVNVIDRSRVVR